MADIQKIIHCIWVGGGNLKDSKGYAGIDSWLKKAPQYEVWLWTDSSRLLANVIRKSINKYREVNKLYLKAQMLQGKGSRLKGLHWADKPGGTLEEGSWDAFLNYLQMPETRLSQEIKDDIKQMRVADKQNQAELLADMHQKKVEVKDVALNKLQTMSYWGYDVEMATRGINFAGASDILRYSILAEYGGIYIDVDLEVTLSFGDLKVKPESRCDLMAPIIPAFGNKPKLNRQPNESPFSIIVGNDFNRKKNPYITNSLLASPKGGKAVTELSNAIRDIYQRILPPEPDVAPRSLTIQKYWYSVPTKSTLDITGPNFVRDILLWSYISVNRMAATDNFIDFSRKRLSFALKGLESVKDLYEKQFRNFETADSTLLVDYVMYNRHAVIWPESYIQYRGFWDWFAKEALFPLGYVKFDTEAAKDSATSGLLNMKF